jgi:hypothetical protein
MRKIVVDNERWEYLIGDSHIVARQRPTKRRYVVTHARLLGMNMDTWERDRRRRMRSCQITPILIADFIRHANWYLTAPLEDIAARYTAPPEEHAWYCESRDGYYCSCY